MRLLPYRDLVKLSREYSARGPRDEKPSTPVDRMWPRGSIERRRLLHRDEYDESLRRAVAEAIAVPKARADKIARRHRVLESDLRVELENPGTIDAAYELSQQIARDIEERLRDVRVGDALADDREVQRRVDTALAKADAAYLRAGAISPSEVAASRFAGEASAWPEQASDDRVDAMIVGQRVHADADSFFERPLERDPMDRMIEIELGPPTPMKIPDAMLYRREFSYRFCPIGRRRDHRRWRRTFAPLLEVAGDAIEGGQNGAALRVLTEMVSLHDAESIVYYRSYPRMTTLISRPMTDVRDDLLEAAWQAFG